MSVDTQKQLMHRSLQCIHLARSIRDQHKDPTKITADDASKMTKLLTEANRLKDLAALEKQNDDMLTWSQNPDQLPDAIRLDNDAAASKVDGGGQWQEQIAKRQLEMFAKAIRSGWKNQNWVDQLDQAEKANLVEDATGEIIVPHDIAGPIFKTLPRLGVFRAAGPTIRPTTSNKVDLRSLTGATAGWGKIEITGAAPTDANVVPNTPADVVEVHDLMAMSKIGADELQDTDANLVSLIQDIVGQQFAQQEDDAYSNGNGVSKPWGLAMRATQATPLITQAVTGVNAAPSGDGLKSLQFRVPSRFRVNGAYFASGDATEAVALLKDTTSNYLWQPSVRAGEPDTFSGKRWFTLEGLPSMGASAAAVDPSIMFGDPALGYLVADRQRITVQRLDERFAELGLVAFIFKLRVGGDVMRPAAFAKYLL